MKENAVLDTIIKMYSIKFYQSIINIAVVVFLSTIIYAKRLPEKINTKIYNQSRMYNVCPVSANIQKFDSSKFMSINFRGDIVYPVGEYKSRRRVYDKKKA